MFFVRQVKGDADYAMLKKILASQQSDETPKDEAT